MRKTIPLVLALLSAPLADAFAQGTAFTYHGRLSVSGAPAGGTHDLRFTLYDSATGGSVVAGPLTRTGVATSQGLFMVTLDFGEEVFTGPTRWLQIEARANSGASFVLLNPRQLITASPYAIHAGTASNVVNNAVVKSLNQLKNDVTLAAGANVTLAANGNTLTISSGGSGGGSGVWALNGASVYYNAGNVGLGTPDPASKLEIAAQDALSIGGSQPFITMFDTSEFGLISPPRRYLQAVGEDLHFLYRRACNTFPCPTAEGHLVIKGNGNVGIGTATPVAKLDVVGRTRTTVLEAATTRTELLETGTARTGVLEVTGGADIAEPFRISSGRIPKGSVVIIDDQHPGALKLSTASYDTRVAGIVSGANGVRPGIRLRQEGVLEDGEHVALSGRVYALADAGPGSIQPGDLLTTSSTPGHAMKVIDPLRAQGAVLGKAMSALTEGRGMVLVLVTLQ